MGLLGFASGVPLLLTSTTLALRLLREYDITFTEIGLFGLATLPYAFKYIWAPVIDRVKIPFLSRKLGRRRSWLLVSQCSLILSLWGLALINLSENIPLTAFLVFCVSFASASQDIVMLAYQAERLGRSTYGAGEAMGIFGYRMGMLLASAGALYMTSFMSWGEVYAVMSLFVLVGTLTTLSMAEPNVTPSKESLLREKKAAEYLHSHPRLKGWKATMLAWIHGAIVCPFSDFMRQRVWLAALLVMFFYKLGDNLIGTMSSIFYADLGFSDIEIANASKIFGMWTSILGGFVGGVLIYRFGMIRSLMWFAFIHGLATLMFVVMVKMGKNTEMLYISIALEHITGGMRTTALFSYQLTLCNVSYAATQLALMTSLVHFGRTIFSSFSGLLVDTIGWELFFYLASFCTIPVLGLVWWLGRLSGEPVFKLQLHPPADDLKLNRIQAISDRKEEDSHAA